MGNVIQAICLGCNNDRDECAICGGGLPDTVDSQTVINRFAPYAGSPSSRVRQAARQAVCAMVLYREARAGYYHAVAHMELRRYRRAIAKLGTNPLADLQS